MIKCKGCGADIPFVPESQNYICPYCNTVHTHEELTEQEKAGEIKAEEHIAVDASMDTSEMPVYIYTCPQCGAELVTTEETYATFCSYCGSSVLLNKREGSEIKPDYIIPFQISKEEAAKLYEKEMNLAVFAPSYIKKMDIEKVRGIYMPYWTYDNIMAGIVYGEKTTSIRRDGGEQVDTYRVTADVMLEGDGIEYDASESFPDDLSQAVGPFHFNKAKQFDASYMSGFYADRGNVGAETYMEASLDQLLDIGKKHVEKKTEIPTGKQIYNVDRQYKAEKALYPVWFISARNKAENKVSYAVVNGETGKVVADLPVDPKKLLIGTLAFALPIFLLIYALTVPTPRATAITTMIMALVGWCITLWASYCTQRKYRLNIFLNLLAAAICLVLSIWNPFQDEYYYGGIIFADALCFISYLLVFIKTNRMMLRKMPQLDARGGDEHVSN